MVDLFKISQIFRSILTSKMANGISFFDISQKISTSILSIEKKNFMPSSFEGTNKVLANKAR